MNTTATDIAAHTLAVAAGDAAKLVGVSRAQWWRLHSAGKLPLPVYLGSKAPRWLVSELRGWLQAGCPDRLSWEKQKAQ